MTSPPNSPEMSPIPEPEVDELSVMMQSNTIVDSDDDSDDEVERMVCSTDTHKEWCKSAIAKQEGTNPNFSKSTADFMGWVMYMAPELYGPDKMEFVPKEQMKAAKKEHNFKEMKNNPSATWANFLK